ncbi:MAG: hypothetical protein ORN27_01380 [Rhodoluna sp.]|nr:hypothetical protein [Rhodoluna sp.]
MIRIPRWPMVTTAFLFGLMHAGLGIYWAGNYRSPAVGWLAVFIYLAAISGTILLHKELEIPNWQGLMNILVAAVLPRMIESQLSPANFGTYATWYIGGLGVLLGATALRGQVYFAWGGLIIATAEILLWESPKNLLNSGWVGLVLLVVIGHAARLGLQVSERAIEKASAEAAEATIQAKRAEVLRNTQSKAFARSVSDVQTILRRAVAQKGKLSEDDRREAMLLENRLSDDVMGGSLITPAISQAARLARLRGVEVYLMDQGVLSTLPDAELDEIHQKVEDVINDQLTGKVTVRATSGNRWRVSIIAFERGSKVPNVDWKF